MRCIFLLALFIGAGSCSPDLGLNPSITQPEANMGRLIFGDYFGFCMGECVHIYKLENGKLYQDITASFQTLFTVPYQGVFEELSADEYEIVKDLPTLIPNELLQETEEILGNPDAYDQGGIYVNFNRDGNSGIWQLDRDVQNLPAYLQNFAGTLRTKVEMLRDRP